MGFITSLNLSDNLAFIGQYDVRRAHQGLGIGSQLWNKALQHIGDRNVALYSTPKMTIKYKNSGFGVDSGIRVLYFNGTISSVLMIERLEGISVIPIDEENIEKVIQYDRLVCRGIDRKLFIARQVKSPDIVAMVALNEREEVVGYGVMCVSSNNKARTDQIYANSRDIAELLLSHCCRPLASRGITQLFYRCLNSNKQAIELANKLNLVRFELDIPLLFTKCVVPFEQDKVFSPPCCTYCPF